MQPLVTSFRLTVLAATLALSACVTPEPATRAATQATALDEIVVGGAAPVARAERWNVTDVKVVVPQSLKVSEANLYFPIADIVWRGDARGDRYAQVGAIVSEAAKRATAGPQSGRPVVAEIEMRRFHALTEKTRYSVGGSYSVKFDLTIRDAATGAVLEGPRRVVAGHPASGGQKALDEEARGMTQKVVVTQFLAGLIAQELHPAAARPAQPGEMIALAH